ncbi:MAG TPA: SDR family NAD(P)-dependent oxidoreductase [Longimicrobiaceae bacterium]|nr:SDR family NAD(P)-dependent oxidoreductase [Longimicrobiaceae bacterium]
MNSWNYAGQWALVTGASSGIGECFAAELAERGMKLVLTARNEARLHEVAQRLRAEFQTEAVVIRQDLTAEGAPAQLWDLASENRHIHLLINNAGFGLRGHFHELSRERQSAMVRVNAVALMELAHLAVPPIRDSNDGGIIPGLPNRLAATLSPLLPRSLTTRLAGLISRRH